MTEQNSAVEKEIVELEFALECLKIANVNSPDIEWLEKEINKLKLSITNKEY